MTLPKNIKTIKDPVEFKFKEKGSQFIGKVYPVETEEDAFSKLAEIKKEHYNATHHCYCYELISGNFKYSDDGEPNGTAGIRIQNAIQHFELKNVLVIVIRYYGGTKLGVGPLGKAYYKAAHDAIENSKIIQLENYTKADIIFDYDFTSSAHHFLSQYEAKIVDTIYKERPSIRFMIKPDKLENLKNDIKEASKAQAAIEIIEENIFV